MDKTLILQPTVTANQPAHHLSSAACPDTSDIYHLTGVRGRSCCAGSHVCVVSVSNGYELNKYDLQSLWGCIFLPIQVRYISEQIGFEGWESDF